MLILRKPTQVSTHPGVIIGLCFIALAMLVVLLPRVAYAERNILFPVLGGGQYSNDYDGRRASGRHEATDIFAAKHTPLVAAVDGTITYVGYPQPSWGYMVQITDRDGYQYNYIHMNNDTPGTDDGRGGPMNAYAADMKVGNRVARGQLVGWVGDSGNAEHTPPHLHFEVVRPDGTTVNPYELLKKSSIKYTIDNRAEYPQLPNENLPYGMHEPGINLAIGNLIESESGQEIVTGAGRKGGPHVKVYKSNMAFSGKHFFAYDKNFTGGVDVATGDIDGDGVDEIITAAGRGGGPHIKVFKADGREIASFFAYDKNFTGGVFVAAGDVDGDGKAEIVTGPGAGGGPNVKIFRGDGRQIGSFFAYTEAFRGGVDVAVGDISGDSKAEIVTAAGPGGGPHVRTMEYVGNTTSPVRYKSSFFAYDKHNFHGGVRVDVGKVASTAAKSQIVTAPASNGGPHIKLFSDVGGTISDRFFMEEWWYGHYDVAAGDGFALAGAGQNRRATVRQGF